MTSARQISLWCERCSTGTRRVEDASRACSKCGETMRVRRRAWNKTVDNPVALDNLKNTNDRPCGAEKRRPLQRCECGGMHFSPKPGETWDDVRARECATYKRSAGGAA